jgi:hypothetical protein
VCAPLALADTLVFSSGRTVNGTVLQTNENNILLLNDYGALNYSRSIIKEVRIERAEDLYVASTNRFPSSKQALLLLSRRPWASNLKQIPATVIDKGILRNVPYISFRCGGDYEAKPYVEGVSLIWRDATGSAGVLMLAELPEDLRAQFGYDAEKAKAAEALKRREAQANAAEYARIAQDVQGDTSANPYPNPASGGGGRVYVRGYTGSNGTYVHSYSRGR